ncbi:tRNA-specific adenosine deaminase subunit tad3 [Pleurostoma richardsiae]|uniref:tRNA-specific adenosine deaminase subunit tad3 n=1 Tax=Pleurostoma richardsiae TaxID=41990 RepID=A0AA38VML1_9PEZI|nr:tRNA-specific adenosine deaminase subunit tad3 [Pleurostoma richardsiae]
MDDETERVVAAQGPVVQSLLPSNVNIKRGVLIPLKTTLELRDEHACSLVYITRAPVKSANAVISLLRTLLPEEIVKGVPHLRRCAKPGDLPAHLKLQFMHESPHSRQLHTTKSQWIYIMLGPEKVMTRNELIDALSRIEGMEDGVFIASVPMPMLAPTSQIQALMWSQQFWPTVYRKNNPLGPHPSMVSRATEEIGQDAAVWMTLAHQVARKAKDAGYGEPVGAVIVQRDGDQSRVVSIAGDARWHQQDKIGNTGNPMAHAVLRAISLVAQKLVRAENREGGTLELPILEFEAFQDRPLLEDEQKIFEMDHPNPDGYLCHGLELYLTHEPCVMCSMAILHSRMGKVVFCKRMPLTGGMTAEDRKHDTSNPNDQVASSPGLGLFWRRELNWSLLAWEWESNGCVHPQHIEAKVHA